MKSDALKIRLPKKTNLEKWHEESNKWLSAVGFWKDEVRFMHKLINENFVYFLSKDNAGSFDALLKKITETEQNQLNVLKAEVIIHEKRLSDHLKYDVDLDMQFFRKEHAKIARDFEQFQNNYRMLKSELFRLSDLVLKEKEMKRLKM